MSKPQQGLELERVGHRNPRNGYIDLVWSQEVQHITFTCPASVYDTIPGWVGVWVAGSYSDIKTNLSQVGLDWDWPTGLELGKIIDWKISNRK